MLNIEEIDAEVKIFDSEDEITKCLIETNIRQRGIGNTNPVKFGRCLKELERIYGVRDGSAGGTGVNQYTNELDQNHSGEATTQEDLASQLGISTDTLRNYKSLADSIPEIQTLIETGIVTPTTARAIIKKLPEFQQKEIADKFASEGIKVPLKKAEEEIKKLKASAVDLREERDYLQSKVNELQSAEPKVIEKVPDDYEELKGKASKSDRLQADKEQLEKLVKELKERKENTSNSDEISLLKQQILTNAKMELADFVTKYSDLLDIKKLLSDILESL